MAEFSDLYVPFKKKVEEFGIPVFLNSKGCI